MRRVLVSMLALVPACGADETDRIELRSALLLKDGHTAIIGLSHRRSAVDGSEITGAAGAFHHAVLVRHDLVSRGGQRLEVVDLGADRESDSFQVQQTHGSWVLLFAPHVDRPGSGYALLDVRTGALERIDVEGELRSKGMAWIGTPHLVNDEGWLICAALPPQGDANISGQDWWIRSVHDAWTLLYSRSSNVFWNDEEVYVEDDEPGTDPASWLAYRPSDGRRRRVSYEEFEAIVAGGPVSQTRRADRDLSKPPDKTLVVRIDPSDPARRPYLSLQERRGQELVETCIEIDLDSLTK